jgi:DNA-binding transcriptional LysR family regulator
MIGAAGAIGVNARQLEIFRAIMRNGSLSAAAVALNVSQPAVSKVLRHFESQIGYRLFERGGGRLVPTPEARLLYGDADRIFREIEVLKTFSDRIRDKKFGLLRVGASAPPTFGILPNAIERFRKRNPGVRLEIQTLPAEEIADRLIIGDIDLGLTMDAITEPLVQSRAIGKTSIVAVMPASVPLARRDTIAPEDLAGETLISYGAKPAIGRLLDRAFRDRGLKFEPQIEINLSIAAAALLVRGLGVALVDAMVPWQSLGPLVCRPFVPKVGIDIVLASNANLPQSRFAKEFARDLQASMSDIGGGRAR